MTPRRIRTAALSLVLPGLLVVGTGIGSPAARQASPATSPVTRTVAATTNADLAKRVSAALSHSTASGVSAAVDIGTTSVLRRASKTGRIPASNEKLTTALTALSIAGPRTTYATSVYRTGTLKAGRVSGSLYLRAAGDPFLSRAQLKQLARDVRAAGVTSVAGHLYLDDTRYDRVSKAAGWASGDFPAESGPLSAMSLDENAYRTDAAFLKDPALPAAATFRGYLKTAGTKIVGSTARRRRPADSPRVAAHYSAQMATVVRGTLVPSDNFAAEMLLKEVGRRASGKAGSTANGIAAVQRFLTKHSIPYGTSKDGSGLARADRRTASGLVRLLQYTSRVAVAPAFGAALPVACSSGTLLHRMCGTAAAGRLYAKTGTLHGVRALSGYTTTRSGKLVVFSFLLNGISDMTAAGNALDAAAVVLASAA